MKKSAYPTKTTMNLFYKPDRTTKPTTIALYVIFVLVLLLGFSKWMVYDVWMEKAAAEQQLAQAQDELNRVRLQLADYDEVHERYIRYSATDEERAIIDRIDVLNMLDEIVGEAGLYTISISGTRVQTQLANVTLAQVAMLVNRLEAHPLVASTLVSTAATTGYEGDGYRNTIGLGGTVVSGGNYWDNADDGGLVQANITIQLQKEAE